MDLNKEFVSYEQAAALKELGFDEPCFSLYFSDGEFSNFIHSYTVNSEVVKNLNGVPAPTFSQVFRWFREKYDLNYSIMPESSSGHRISTRIYNVFIHSFIMNTNVQTNILRVDNNISRYISYEEAENACIDKLIELAKQQ